MKKYIEIALSDITIKKCETLCKRYNLYCEIDGDKQVARFIPKKDYKNIVQRIISKIKERLSKNAI